MPSNMTTNKKPQRSWFHI